MNSEPTYTLQDYIDAVRRRISLGLAIAVPILFGAAALALFLDDVYTATTRIDIDLQGTNVRTLEPIQVTTYAEQYIDKLEDRVMKSQTLAPLANEPGLFPPEFDELSEGTLLSIIRDSIDVRMVTQPVTTPAGRTVDLITGFQVAVDSVDPKYAFRVSEFVAERFLEADRESRTARASSTSTFLREQMTKTEREIVEFEQQVADFKVVNACCLPELMDLNMSVIQRTERDIENLQPRIRTLEKDRTFKLSQIEEITQQAGSTSHLADLEAEYLRLVANYGPEHPDVIRIRREIAAITGASAGSGSDAYELVELRIQLAEAEQRYSAEHPDVIRYKREIAALVARQELGGDAATANARLLDNPRYLLLRAELNNIETELGEQRRRVPELREKILDYENRLTRTPQIESEYQALNRKLNTARDNFENLQNRLVIANQTEALESTEIGARLTESRHASVPDSPSGPPRIAIMVIAVFLAGTFGLGSMLLAEMTDSTIRGRKDIESIMDMVPLATIPVIENVADHAARVRRTYLLAGFMLLTITIIALINWSGVL